MDPATSGPISEFNHSWSPQLMQLSLPLDCNYRFFAFGVATLCESSYDLGLKKGGPCPKSPKVVRFPGWSALEAVRVSTVATIFHQI